jgi:hypothetical protein
MGYQNLSSEMAMVKVKCLTIDVSGGPYSVFGHKSTAASGHEGPWRGKGIMGEMQVHGDTRVNPANGRADNSQVLGGNQMYASPLYILRYKPH